MKPNYTKSIFSVFSFLTLASISTFGQLIPLPNEAKFKLGDNMDWAQPMFDDSQWKSQQLGTSWLLTDLKDSIYAWYRIKVIIPSSIKQLAIAGNGIKLAMGKIDDVDQTFFNGKLIGQTGSMPPNYNTKWDAWRTYIISPQDVKWDEENTIAVRVYNHIGGAGMYEGPYGFGPIQWSDFVKVSHSIVETSTNGFATKIKFVNNRDVALDATVKYWVTTKESKELFTETKPLHLARGTGMESIVSFSSYNATSDRVVRVGYEIIETGSLANLKADQLYLATRAIEISVATTPKPIVLNKVTDLFIPSQMEDVQLRGYLGQRLKQNLEQRLLKVDEDGLMGSYLQRPGIHPWAGEHVGKYLETASNVWRNTHDVRLKKQMDRMMFELINTQEADGYLGTYTKDKHWTSWDVWSHKYNLYGLLAYYEATGYQPALEACKKMGDLLATTFGNKANQLDIILAGTHMGMAATSVLDPMVELYRYTGDKKYLDFCYYIVEAWEHDNGPKIISRLLNTGKVNKVGNGKSYEMLSNFLGLTNLYRLTGDEALIKPVLIAWQDIIDNRLYITGTTSAWEYFQEEGVLPAEEESHMGEGCVTTTWLQLNQSLFSITGDLKFYEQIEKTIYNHLLAAENPLTGCVSYYTPLMGIKPFTCYITCCQSSVPRGMALLPPFAFGKINQLPTLVLYEEASYKTSILSNDKKSIDLKISVQSKFPENGNLSINVGIIKKANFTLALRVPAWSSSFVAIVGGKEYKGNSNESILIDRTWNNNDRIAISFDMPIHTKEGGKNYAGQIAFMRGPQVLAYDASINRELPIDFLQTATKLSVRKPVVAKEKQLLPTTWIGKQVYNVSAPGTSVVAKHIRLVPYADASQTGGSIKVWLPLTVAEY